MISNKSKTLGFLNKLSKFFFGNRFTKVAHSLWTGYRIIHWVPVNDGYEIKLCDLSKSNPVPVETRIQEFVHYHAYQRR